MYYMGVWIAHSGRGTFGVGMPGHARGRFTKGNGSLGRRCGLLSNYCHHLFYVCLFVSGISQKVVDEFSLNLEKRFTYKENNQAYFGMFRKLGFSV